MSVTTSLFEHPPVDDQILEFGMLVRELKNDGRLSLQASQDIMVVPRSKVEEKLHPLSFIANQLFDDAANPGKRLDAECLAGWLAEKTNIPYYRVDPLKIDVQGVTKVMSSAFSQRHQILAVELTTEQVIVGTAEPFVNSWQEHLQAIIPGKTIKRVLINPADLRRYMLEFYNVARSVESATHENQLASQLGISNLEQMLELGSMASAEANDAHIVNLVDWLLQYAFDQRSSDIHIEPRRENGHVRFRIDGVLHTVYEFPLAVMAAITSRLKILGRMDVAEKRRPQDGRLKTRNIEQQEVELRLSTLPTAFGEKMVMRIFDPDVLLKTFEELGLANEDLKRWEHMVAQPNGIVLVTGPTGSGKTTTLYSSLKRLATSEVNVCTVEDPIEMVEPSFNQMQVQANIDLSFSSGVRALLRQDPDIIMVGEIRDLETAEMATQAALTGHLVLSTLHTNDSPTAVTRLLELGVPSYLIKATVLGIMAQRLVRTLCPLCKVEDEVDLNGWMLLTTPWKVAPPKKVYRAGGCIECRNTGFMGRAGIYEIMPLTEEIKSHISADTELSPLRRTAMKAGMKTLRLSGAQKVAQGLTTIAEIVRVVPTSYQD